MPVLRYCLPPSTQWSGLLARKKEPLWSIEDAGRGECVEEALGVAALALLQELAAFDAGGRRGCAVACGMPMPVAVLLVLA